MMAIVMVATSTVFAGDSDALKAILKSKTYADAEQLLKSSLDQLTSNEEKAKAYNKLVELALARVSKVQEVVAENERAKLLKQELAPVDSIGLADALCDALNAAVKCDEYDRQPNAKGQVKPKFADTNNERLWGLRGWLINVGQAESQKHNNDALLKYWGAFLDSDGAEIFAKQDKEAEKGYIGQVGYYAGAMALEKKQMERANRYLEYALKDETMKKDAMNMQIGAMKSALKTKEDTLAFIKNMQARYEKDEDNDVIFSAICEMYEGMKNKEAQSKMIEDRLAKNPKSFVALANKGMMALNDNKSDEAIKYLKEAKAVNPENPVVLTYLGICLSYNAENVDDKDQRTALYQEAIENFDKAKAADPDMRLIRWAPNRAQAYYALYGPDDPKTKAAEADRDK